MARIFHEETKVRWDIWLSEQKCQSSENFEDGRVVIGNVIPDSYELLVKRSKLENFFNKFSMPEKKVALLSAHGGTVYGKWKWFDGPNENSPLSYKSVEEWVGERDKEGYNLILLGVCNERKERIKTERTPIIYPEGIIGLLCDYTAIGYNPLTKRRIRRPVQSLMQREEFDRLKAMSQFK